MMRYVGMDDIVYSIFPDIGGLFSLLYEYDGYNQIGATYFMLLGISLGINFIASIFDTRY